MFRGFLELYKQDPSTKDYVVRYADMMYIDRYIEIKVKTMVRANSIIFSRNCE